MPESKVLPDPSNVKINEIRAAMQRVERAREQLRAAIAALRQALDGERA